jgi:hypothetical protein
LYSYFCHTVFYAKAPLSLKPQALCFPCKRLQILERSRKRLQVYFFKKRIIGSGCVGFCLYAERGDAGISVRIE